VTCPLSSARGSQGTGPRVLAQALRAWTFQSGTNNKNRMVLGEVKELGLVFWHRWWETMFHLGAHLYRIQTTLGSSRV
jgi:hypothetical protein